MQATSSQGKLFCIFSSIGLFSLLSNFTAPTDDIFIGLNFSINTEFLTYSLLLGFLVGTLNFCSHDPLIF